MGAGLVEGDGDTEGSGFGSSPKALIPTRKMRGGTLFHDMF